MGRLCIVYGCNITSANKQGISTHGFPTVPHIRKAWIDFVKMSRKDFSQPKYHQAICGQHFAVDAFADQFTAPLFESELGYRPNRRLKEDAVPSVIPLTCINMQNKLNAAKRTVATTDEEVSNQKKRQPKGEVMKQSDDRSQPRQTVSGCDRMEEEEWTVKTEVKTERDTQEPLLCTAEQHSQEPAVKMEVKTERGTQEPPPVSQCTAEQHSQEPGVKTEVKIEIDVAEEPPLAWFMTQQHSHVSVKEDFTTESTASIKKEQTTETQAEFLDQCSSSQESVKHHNRQVSEHIKSESRDAEDTTVVTGDTQFIPTHQDEGAGAESSAMARDDTTLLTRSPYIYISYNSQSPSSQDGVSSEESSTGLDHLTACQSNSLKGESLQKEMRTQPENSTGQNKRERGHKTPKGNSCTQCNSSFCYPSLLKRHMLTHTGERPYKCVQCSASFNRPSVLKHHMFTHTGEKPYSCAQCSASFSWPSVLKQHMFTHTGERPYRCTHCSASFTWPSTLKRHMETHGVQIWPLWSAGPKKQQIKVKWKLTQVKGHTNVH